MDLSLKAISQAAEFSNKSIKKLRQDLKKASLDSNILVVTVGSFARREASLESDIDYFVLYKGKKSDAEDGYKVIEDILKISGS